MDTQWNHKIFGVQKEGFEKLALEIFHFQYKYNSVYRAYVDALGVIPGKVSQIEQIPFLPVSFFKTHKIKTGEFDAGAIFESSGTSGSVNSHHYVKDVSLYEESFEKAFAIFYGNINTYCILGLLPTYLERKNASLVYMTDKLIKLSNYPQSGFYLDQLDTLASVLKQLEKDNQPVLLIGVTFALLDFAEKNPSPLGKHIIIMETGGMKGRREEMIRLEVHKKLKTAFEINTIHSEYGMTELLSQAYSKGEGIFHCPPWMKILVREEEDPLQVKRQGRGAVNIIDLANVHSCCFIATDDAGKVHEDESFEIAGRMDGSDLRGCSLLVLP